MIMSQLLALGGQALLLSLYLFVARPVLANQWEAIETPYASQASAIGGYANGCLKGAQALPLDGEGYQVIRPQRHRYYGHPTLIEFIQQFAASLNRQGSDDILIADMSMPRGGNFTQGHSSHQIGLDVDVWFKQASQPLTLEERAQPIALKLVDKKQFTLDTQLWSPAQTQMIKQAALDERVARIFVSPVIKQHLCDLGLENDVWLNKVRPWWGHTYHMHVRLSCPRGNPLCREQASIPIGNGCHELGWWKRQLTQTQPTQIAKTNKSASKPKKKKAKVKPKQCSLMLAAK